MPPTQTRQPGNRIWEGLTVMIKQMGWTRKDDSSCFQSRLSEKNVKRYYISHHPLSSLYMNLGLI